MDASGLTVRKQKDISRQADRNTVHDDYQNTDINNAPDKHSAENQSRKRGRHIFNFVFSVYTATIIFAVFITFTCAFLIVRIQELEVFLYHQDGYIRELRNQFEGLNQDPKDNNKNIDNIASSSSSSSLVPQPETDNNNGIAASRHLLGREDPNCDCPPGSKGDQGPRGERGRQGGTGREGDKGHRGDSGKDGRHGKPGPRGDSGDRGQKGQKGDRGEDGTKGHRGHKGDRGLRGFEGPAGKPGYGGRRGRRGERGDRGFLGPPGPRGIPGELVGVNITELLSHTIKAIHLQGVPQDTLTGITRLDMYGTFNQWKPSSHYGGDTFVKDLDGNITVREGGQYLIYSRVLFYDSSAFYGATTNINGKPFIKCGGARASAAVKFGPCMSIGVASLRPGDSVGVTSSYGYRDVEMNPESTYFGLVKLN